MLLNEVSPQWPSTTADLAETVYPDVITNGHSRDLITEQQADRSQEVYRLNRNSQTGEVTVESDITLEDTRKVMRPEDWQALLNWAEPFVDKTIVFLNSTMEGGGVAMMRPPLVHLLKQLGVKAHWYVLEDIKDKAAGKPFEFTKNLHNVSQRKSDKPPTEEGIALHWHWADSENGPMLEKQDPIINADVLFIDDPQPAPLYKRLKQANQNPNHRVVWRNHIDTDGELMADPTTPQGKVASYLLDVCGLREVDAIIAHPVESFVHKDPALYDKTYFAPATF